MTELRVRRCRRSPTLISPSRFPLYGPVHDAYARINNKL
jgi:hypothetical protein